MTRTPPVHRFSLLGRNITFDPDCVKPKDTGLADAPALPVRSVALDISGTCNLRCRYCAESSTLPTRHAMSEELLRQSLDFVFSQVPENHAVSVHLGSGEPLIQASLVQLISDVARRNEREQKKPVDLYITTNGTLLDEGMIAHLGKYGWNVKVSLDGPADVHDRFRRDKAGGPTFDRVSHSIRQLLKIMPETLSTTSVICHGTDPASVFSAVGSMGVKKIELVPVAMPDDPCLRLDDADLAKYRSFMAEYVRRLARGEDLPTLIRFRNRLQRSMGFFNTCIACDAGRSFLAVGPDGTFYPCFRFAGLSEYSLGSLTTGVSEKKRTGFTGSTGRPYQSRDCVTCWASPVCGGPCFAVTDLMCQGRPDPVYCSIVRAETEAALYLAEVLREQDPEKLLALAGIPTEFDNEDSAR